MAIETSVTKRIKFKGGNVSFSITSSPTGVEIEARDGGSFYNDGAGPVVTCTISNADWYQFVNFLGDQGLLHGYSKIYNTGGYRD